MKRRKQQPNLIPRQTDQLSQCALCQREVMHITRHHLIPRAEGG